MTVPETSIHENHGAVPGEYEVRTAGKVFAVQAVADAFSVETTS